MQIQMHLNRPRSLFCPSLSLSLSLYTSPPRSLPYSRVYFPSLAPAKPSPAYPLIRTATNRAQMFERGYTYWATLPQCANLLFVDSMSLWVQHCVDAVPSSSLSSTGTVVYARLTFLWPEHVSKIHRPSDGLPSVTNFRHVLCRLN